MIRFLRQPDSHAVAALCAWLICSALYLWTANGIVIQEKDRLNAWHHYEYLVDGLLAGHLYLSPGPSKELLALPDPYDPKANLPYRLWDASLYQGHYYLYYGPTPALLLMLPWKVVTGCHLPQRLATAIFAVAGLSALTLLMAGIRRRCFPAASSALLFWTIILIGHVNWLPVVLRRPAFWELPIVTAAALFWWSLYFLWRYHESGGSRGWTLAAGVSLGLALGVRPTYVFAACFIAVLFAFPFERGFAWQTYLRRLFPAAIPLAIGVGGLLVYNYARFGRLLEFGQSCQLWATDERSFRLRLTVNEVLIVETPFLPCPGATLRVVCAAPRLYPPAAHPYWDAVHDPARRKLLQTAFIIGFGENSYARQSTWGFDAINFQPRIRTASERADSCAWVERVSQLPAAPSSD
jgi:hypothetical protein